MRLHKIIIALSIVAGIVMLIYDNANATEKYRAEADQFMANLVGEKFDAVVATFTPDVAAQLPQATLEQVWSGLNFQMGKLNGYDYAKSVTMDTLVVHGYRMNFENMPLLAQITYNPAGKVCGFYFRPIEGEKGPKPEYVLPPYVDTATFTEATFEVPGDTIIPGAVVIPKTGQPCPVVLLVPGSGPLDRDEQIEGKAPLKDIAWGLATQGIASVRFDNRSYVVGLEKTPALDLNGYLMDDIASLLAYIRTQPEKFDTDRMYIAGHSLGAMVAPLAAARDGELAGIIMLSASARPLPDVVVEQFEYLTSLTGDSLSDKDNLELDKVKEVAASIEERSFPPGEMFVFASGQVWYDLMDNNNVDLAKTLDIPMLIIQGGRDYQVTDTDFDIWKQELAGKKQVSFKRYANLNHLYQPGEGLATNLEYVSNDAPVNVDVIVDMANWIKGIGK